MYSFISLFLVFVGLLSENIFALFVAALFAFASNVEIHITVNKEDKQDVA